MSHLFRGVLVKLNYLLTNGGYKYNIQYLFLTTNVEKFQNPECGKVLINFVYFWKYENVHRHSWEFTVKTIKFRDIPYADHSKRILYIRWFHNVSQCKESMHVNPSFVTNGNKRFIWINVCCMIVLTIPTQRMKWNCNTSNFIGKVHVSVLGSLAMRALRKKWSQNGSTSGAVSWYVTPPVTLFWGHLQRWSCFFPKHDY